MSTLEIIHNILSHAHAPSDKSFDKRGLNPVRDWLLGVFVFFVILIVGGVFSVYRFMQYVDISVDTQINNQKVVSYNKGAVDEALRMYGAKKSEFARLEQNSQEAPVILDIVPATTTSVETSSTPQTTATTSGEGIQISN